MSDPEREARIKTLFEEVVDLTPAARSARLDEICPETLRADVDELLRYHDTPPQGNAFGLTPVEEAFQNYATATADSFAPFERLDEFRILRKIGEGGMATVYLAEDTSPLQRLVALKVLSHATESQLARFMEEARSLAKLNHPNIVTAHKVGFDQGVHYIVMDYVEGSTLVTEIMQSLRTPGEERRRVIGSNEYLRSKAQLAAVVADALDHAHQNGVVHRDVKPSNILLDEEGEPHLSDFGIARNLATKGLTESGATPGTIPYMSPEQAKAREHQIDLRTDIFSLGVVLYELITLEQPFQGDSIQEILSHVMFREPKRPRVLNRGVSKDLETIVLKALEKSPDRRYQTAAHLAADLRAWLTGVPILARPTSFTRTVFRTLARHRFAASIALVVGLIAVTSLSVTAVLRTSFGRLSVHAPEGAEVWMIAHDDESLLPTEATRIGSVPIRNRYIKPGHKRFTIVVDDETHVSCNEIVERGKRTVVTVPETLRPKSEVVEGMVFFPAGYYTFGRDDPQSSFDSARPVWLDGFWLDRGEVTHREYREFVLATGHREPEIWENGYDPAWDELPMADVSWEDAEAFARWKGKRLPTVHEWECAARAPNDWRWPWGDDATLPYRLSTPLPDVLAMHSNCPDFATLFQIYFRNVRSVEDSEEPATASGLVHMFGNLMEMTASTKADDDWAPVVKGGAWYHVAHAELDGTNQTCRDLTMHSIVGRDKTFPNIGFRCAKSDKN